MLSDKLLSLLSSFSKSKLNSFKKYLSSPFFNENKDLIILFEMIHKQLSSSSSNGNDLSALKKEAVWKKLYPQKKYADVQLRRLCSDLTKIAQSFLAYHQFKKTPFQEDTLLLSAINKPDLDKHFAAVVRQTKVMQEKAGFRDADFHYNTFLIEQNCHKHLELLKKKPENLENLENADYHLDCFYITKKLMNYCDFLGYKNILSFEINAQLFPSFLELIKNSEFRKEPSVNAYFLVAQMLLHPDDESHAIALKQLLFEQSDKFSKVELKLLYVHLKNYYITIKINAGLHEYYTNLFEIFEMQINQGNILDNDVVSAQNYKNIISVGLHLKQFDWVEQFIQTFTEKLPKENQDNNLKYNLAKVYFYKEDYPKVIEQLREVEYKTPEHSLGGKLMLLKTYYELKESMALDSLIDSFSIYLRRNRLISKEMKQQCMNVLRFTKKLTNIPQYDKNALEKIKIQIENSKALAAKNWLLEKVEERL